MNGITQYEAFLKAVELKTLSEAADVLGYTQSGMTKLLNNLESNLGVRLLNRGRNGVTLTSEGQVLLPYIRSVVNTQNTLDEQVRSMKGLESGMLRIGTSNSVSVQWLPGIMKAFLADHPGFRFELLYGLNSDVEMWLRESRIDLGFVHLPLKTVGITEFLMRDPIVALFSEHEDCSRRESFPVEQLPEFPFVAVEAGKDTEIEDVLRTHHLDIEPRFTADTDQAVYATVEQGLAIALMPKLMLDSFHGNVRGVPLEPPAYRDLALVYPQEEQQTHAVKSFLPYVRDFVQGYKETVGQGEA